MSPWNPYDFPHGPGGPGSNAIGHPSMHGPGIPNPDVNANKTAVFTIDKGKGLGPGSADGVVATTELSAMSSPSATSAPSRQGPPLPVESKPSAAEVQALSDSIHSNTVATAAATGKTGGVAGKPQVPVALPLPRPMVATPESSIETPKQTTTAATTNITAATTTIAPVPTVGVGSAARGTVADATETARAAVARAMAQLQGGSANNATASMDNLTRQVHHMRMGVNNAQNQHQSQPGGLHHQHQHHNYNNHQNYSVGPGGPYGVRGRGGGSSGGRFPYNQRGPRTEIKIPDSDFDFDGANAKFNKEEAFKDVTSPDAEAAEEEADTPDGVTPSQAYNKTRSFFDNIGSDAKERADSGVQRPGGRQWRNDEERKNVETFGEGRVDDEHPHRGRGGHRGHRGRGGYGRGGYGRGGGGGGGLHQGYHHHHHQQ